MGRRGSHKEFLQHLCFTLPVPEIPPPKACFSFWLGGVPFRDYNSLPIFLSPGENCFLSPRGQLIFFPPLTSPSAINFWTFQQRPGKLVPAGRSGFTWGVTPPLEVDPFMLKTPVVVESRPPSFTPFFFPLPRSGPGANVTSRLLRIRVDCSLKSAFLGWGTFF